MRAALCCLTPFWADLAFHSGILGLNPSSRQVISRVIQETPLDSLHQWVLLRCFSHARRPSGMGIQWASSCIFAYNPINSINSINLISIVHWKPSGCQVCWIAWFFFIMKNVRILQNSQILGRLSGTFGQGIGSTVHIGWVLLKAMQKNDTKGYLMNLMNHLWITYELMIPSIFSTQRINRNCTQRLPWYPRM